MVVVVSEAKLWKKGFRSLKKDYEFDERIYQITHHGVFRSGLLADISEKGISVEWFDEM